MVGQCEGTFMNVYLYIAQLGTNVTLDCQKSYDDHTPLDWNWETHPCPLIDCRSVEERKSESGYTYVCPCEITQDQMDEKSTSFTCRQNYANATNTESITHVFSIGKEPIIIGKK